MPGLYLSGGSWSSDGGSIVFAAGSPSSLFIVAAAGGTASLLVSPQMLENRPADKPAGQARASGWIAQPHFLSAEGFTVSSFHLFQRPGCIDAAGFKDSPPSGHRFGQ